MKSEQTLRAWTELKAKITSWNSSELLVEKSLKFYRRSYMDVWGNIKQQVWQEDSDSEVWQNIAQQAEQKASDCERLLTELGK